MRFSEEHYETAAVKGERSQMSTRERIDRDIAEAQRIIRMDPEFFVQLYDYRKAKLAFDSLWASISEREGNIPL